MLKLDLTQITRYMHIWYAVLYVVSVLGPVMFVFYDFQVHENHKLLRNFYNSLQLLCNYIAGPKDVQMSAEGSSSIFLFYMPYLPAKAATKLHCSSEANYFIRILNTMSGFKFI